MYIRPGTPDDDNREYLPEKIKGSDIVVNENGNNSQPYPERLKEFHGVIADGTQDEWYEYVPERYDPSENAAGAVYARGTDDRVGTGHLYILDHGGGPGRFHRGIPQRQLWQGLAGAVGQVGI